MILCICIRRKSFPRALPELRCVYIYQENGVGGSGGFEARVLVSLVKILPVVRLRLGVGGNIHRGGL